jgi:hypothetical protein
MERHAPMLVRLHARINTESIAIAGPAYEEYHTVGFDANGFQMANDMANRAGKVALRRPAPAPRRVSAAPPPPFAMKPLVPWSKPRARCRLSVGVSRALSPLVSIYTCFGIYTAPSTRTCTLRQAS